MSYDLYMKPADPGKSWDDFCQYFASRPNYTIQGPQIWYNNPDTSVYFVFEDLTAGSNSAEDNPYLVHFNMNYFRPRFFGLEAEPELTAFVEHFGMSVEDPQIDGMGEGEYSPERFVSGWNKGNEFGYSSILRQQPAEYSRPTEELEQIWRWNFGRTELQQSLGEHVFVPKVMFIASDGNLHTTLVWPDGIPTVMVPVDSLLIHRDELAPRRWFKKNVSTDLVPWSDVESLISEHWTPKDGYWVPNEQTRPAAIEKFVRKLPSKSRELVQIDGDQILDRSLVEKCSP